MPALNLFTVADLLLVSNSVNKPNIRKVLVISIDTPITALCIVLYLFTLHDL